MPTSERAGIESMVLPALFTKETISLPALRQRLPHLKSNSIAGALSVLTAERSVRRVGRGLYRLTEQGWARRVAIAQREALAAND